MAVSAVVLRPMFALALLAVLSYPSFAATNPPPTFNRLCQQQKLTSQPQWRKCAELTVAEWNRANVDADVRPSLPAASVIYAGLIDPKIVLRVEPVGKFTGLEMVMEFWNIFANPTGPAHYFEPLSYTIRRFTATRPIAVATVDYVYLNTLTGATANLTFEQWFRFDNYSRVAAADITLDRFAEFALAIGVEGVFSGNPNITSLIKNIVCNSAINYCRLPSLQQYADVPTCLDFISSLPVLNPLRLQSNTVLCRYLHSHLVSSAPEIHCPHIGPSGGGACVDEPYSAYYSASPFPTDVFALQ